MGNIDADLLFPENKKKNHLYKKNCILKVASITISNCKFRNCAADQIFLFP